MNKLLFRIQLLGFAASYGGLSFANSTGAQSLGSALTEKDIFRFVYFTWGNGIHPIAPADEFNGPASRFTANINVTGGIPTTTKIQTLPIGLVHPTTSTSPTKTGIHYFIISHVTSGSRLYSVTYDCFNQTGILTGVGEDYIGNPPNVTPAVDFVRTLNV